MPSEMSATHRLLDYQELYIGGRWTRSSGGRMLEVRSPATEELLATVPDPSVEDAERAITMARRAFDDGPWQRLSPAERADYVERLAVAVELRAEQLNWTFTAEAGIPISVSPWYMKYALETLHDAVAIGREFELEEERERVGHGQITVRREPVGVVLGICPWNAPMPMMTQKLAPALIAGCTVVLKPAQEDPVVAFLFAEAAEEAGLPEGVVSVLPASRDVGAYMVRHPAVDKVTFTGSTASGSQIMTDCANRIARVTLELGGKSAAIVLEDATPEQVLPHLVPGFQVGCGQACVALSRILVPRQQQAEWADALGAAMAAVPVGDPFDPLTLQGPLISRRQRERVEGYVESGRREGARIVIGGRRPTGLDRGFFFEATLFDQVSNDMRIAQEEIFGPVACLLGYREEAEAVAIANDSTYGLAGSVFGQDSERLERIARELRTGAVTINGAGPCTIEPFGGYKRSGLGREGGREGLDSFLEVKQIVHPTVAV